MLAFNSTKQRKLLESSTLQAHFRRRSCVLLIQHRFSLLSVLVALQLGNGDLVRGCPGFGGVRRGAAHCLAGAHGGGPDPGDDAVVSFNRAVPLDRALVAVHLPAAIAPLHGVADRAALRYLPCSLCFEFQHAFSMHTDYTDCVVMERLD